MKQEIAATCEVKSKFLNNLASSGADFQKVFASTNKFTSLNLKIDQMFACLIKKCQAKFTPLTIIYGLYQYHIKQNIFEAKRIIQKYIKNKFNFDMRLIANLPMQTKEEMMAISVSMEQANFHQINYCSCNCFSFLEYDAHELLNRDLNLLVPSPLSDYHQQLMMPANLTGVLFERKNLSSISIKKKNGYLTSCSAVFRMNYRIDRSLEVVGALLFDKETLGLKNLIVVNEDMMITEISELSTDLFQKNTYVYQYNRRFKKIFKCLNHVCQFKLQSDNIEIESLMDDPKILESFSVYFDYLNGDNIEIVDKNGEKQLLHVSLSIVYMPSVLKYIRFLEYKVVQDNFTGEFTTLNISDPEQLSYQTSVMNNTTDNLKMLMKNKKPYNYSLLDSKEKKLKVLVEYLSRSSYMQTTNLSLASESHASGLDFDAGNKTMGIKHSPDNLKIGNHTMHNKPSISDSRDQIGVVPEEYFKSSFSPVTKPKPKNPK